MERTRKKVHLWKKAIAHFCLCFVMGFFTGFFPTGKNSSNFTHSHIVSTYQPEFSSPQPNETFQQQNSSETQEKLQRFQLSEREQGKEDQEPNLKPKKLVILVTPMSSKDRFGGVFLRRLANTMGLVSPPILWIVVDGITDDQSNEANEVLRKTRVMYRHLASKDNFTESEAELDHRRNIALKHIEKHRLSGIVHFAALENVYDLEFFDELRKIEAFGTWPMAILSANRNKVRIEGPVCDSSQVIGWHLRKLNNETETDSKPPIHISSFGFNSSILWDPERWGRTSSVQSTSQSSITFVKQVVVEDETEMMGIPEDNCSKITLWRLQFPIQMKPRNRSPPTSIHGFQR